MQKYKRFMVTSMEFFIVSVSENWTGSTLGLAKTGPGPLLAERKLDRTFGLQKLDRVCISLRRQSAKP